MLTFITFCYIINLKLNKGDYMDNILGKRLKELRIQNEKLQKDIANYLSITTSAYGYYEKGERQPNPEILLKLAKYFNVSTDYLLGRTDTPNNSEEKLTIAASMKNGLDISDMTDDEKKFITDFVNMVRKNKK